MKLHFAAASPFVRKVRIVASELGLDDRIELATHAVTPINPVDDLNQANPLGKIPALQLEDGSTLYDSRVICDYLNDLGNGSLLPAAGPDLWQAKKLEALADGICDALVGTRYETFLRPEEFRWPEWIRNQLNKAIRGLDHLEATSDNWTSHLTIGSIAVACTLDYIDFRFAELNWREDRPKLAAWYDEFAKRPTMVATKPA